MFRSILVPLDGSTFGEHALPLAMSLARRAGAVLHLVHVHQVVPPATIAGVAVMDSIDIHLRQDEQAYLADVARRLNEVKAPELKTVLIDGDVAPALREYAQKHAVDLVVMGTHGRGALGRFWLGSVTDEMVHDMHRPVLLVRPHEGKPDLRRDVKLENILVPLDGTPLAEQVIDYASDLGKLYGANLTLVRVIQPVLRPSYLPEGTSIIGMTHSVLEEVQAVQRQHLAQAQAYLDEISARLASRGDHVHTRVVVDEQPAVGLMIEAQVRHADLIAMETHARRGLPRLFLGSVADKIVRGGMVPVLLNRPAE